MTHPRQDSNEAPTSERPPHEGEKGSQELDRSPREGEENAPDGRQIKGLSWVLVASCVLTSTFLFGFDNTIVANIQPAIIYEFGSIEKISWLSVTFLAGAASTTLFWGQMYGRFNPKWLYFTCITLFEVGSAVCGAAPNMDALIVGRAICGLGGTGMYTGVLTLFSILTDPFERSTYFALCGLVWGIGNVLGPILGGAFASGAAGWRWSFWINIVIYGACSPVYIFLIPSIPVGTGSSWLTRLAEIDFIGVILLIGVFLSFLMGISFGGLLYAWNSAQIIALFTLAAVLSLIFLGQQFWTVGTTKERRAFPLEFFANKSLSLLFILESCASTLLFIPLYFLPLYFQFVREDSAIEAGVRLLPLMVFLVVAIVINGFVVTANGLYMPWFLTGGVLGLIGSALLYTVDTETSNAKVYGYSILIATGSGCFLQLPFSVVQSFVTPEEVPQAVGFVTTSQLGSPSLMLALVNAVFLNEASLNIARSVPSLSRNEIIGILSGVGSATFSKLSAVDRTNILTNIVQGLDKGYIVTMVSGGLAVVLSLFLNRNRMFR